MSVRLEDRARAVTLAAGRAADRRGRTRGPTTNDSITAMPSMPVRDAGVGVAGDDDVDARRGGRSSSTLEQLLALVARRRVVGMVEVLARAADVRGRDDDLRAAGRAARVASSAIACAGGEHREAGEVRRHRGVRRRLGARADDADLDAGDLDDRRAPACSATRCARRSRRRRCSATRNGNFASRDPRLERAARIVARPLRASPPGPRGRSRTRGCRSRPRRSRARCTPSRRRRPRRGSTRACPGTCRRRRPARTPPPSAARAARTFATKPASSGRRSSAPCRSLVPMIVSVRDRRCCGAAAARRAARPSTRRAHASTSHRIMAALYRHRPAAVSSSSSSPAVRSSARARSVKIAWLLAAHAGRRGIHRELERHACRRARSSRTRSAAGQRRTSTRVPRATALPQSTVCATPRSASSLAHPPAIGAVGTTPPATHHAPLAAMILDDDRHLATPSTRARIRDTERRSRNARSRRCAEPRGQLARDRGLQRRAL